MEEAYGFKNYLSPQNQIGEFAKNIPLTSQKRRYAIQLMIDLQRARNYYVETLTMAVQIFDRFMFLVTMGHCTFDEKRLNSLVCTCLIIAAKFEQPKKPDLYNMINALIDIKGQVVSKEELIDMERQIIIQFGFDFNFSSTILFLERFLQVLGLQDDELVKKTSL